LYLKPPSPGGLCEGVSTIPLADPRPTPPLYSRIVYEITGAGVGVDDHVDAVGDKYLDGRLGGRPRQRARVARNAATVSRASLGIARVRFSTSPVQS
jgi:hypothetical protein